jgi:DNA-binding transcriptional ArsR family regulator
MTRTDAVFSALADPTRRHLIEALASEPASATRLAADLPITRQAVAKHLAGLRAARLVNVERAGREAVYSLDPAPLTAAADWIARVGAEWDVRLADLRRALGPS